MIPYDVRLFFPEASGRIKLSVTKTISSIGCNASLQERIIESFPNQNFENLERIFTKINHQVLLKGNFTGKLTTEEKVFM